jgi:hypothetical protein
MCFYLRIHLKLNEVLLELQLLLPDLLHLFRITFNQILWVNLKFLLSLFLFSSPTLFFFFLNFLICLFVGRVSHNPLRLLLPEHEGLELYVEHLDGPQPSIGQHRVKQVSVTERELTDHAFKQVQESAKVDDAHVGLLIGLLKGVLRETIGCQVV